MTDSGDVFRSHYKPILSQVRCVVHIKKNHGKITSIFCNKNKSIEESVNLHVERVILLKLGDLTFFSCVMYKRGHAHTSYI